MSTPIRQDFREQAALVQRLVERVEQGADPETTALAQLLLRTVLDLHADALRRLLDLIARAGPAANGALDQWTREESGRGLLLLHGLHPEPVERRIARGVEAAARALVDAGYGVELLGVNDGVVSVRVEATREGCASGAEGIRTCIESAVYAWAPELERVQIQGLPPPSGLIQLGVSAPHRTSTPDEPALVEIAP